MEGGTIWCNVRNLKSKGAKRIKEFCDDPDNPGSHLPLCDDHITAIITERIQLVATTFDIEFDTIDKTVDTKKMIENPEFSHLFKEGYKSYLMMTSQADIVESIFENLLLTSPLDITIQIVTNLMEDPGKINYKKDLAKVGIKKEC